MKQSVRLRLVVTDPLPGAHYAVQRGRSDLLAPTSASGAVIFDFSVLADLSLEPPRLTGEFAQGPPDKRFVYVNSGTYAGQSDTTWSRRAKVPITGISASLIREAFASEGVLQAHVRGTGKDGGPFCATVALSSDWIVVASS